MNAIVGFSNLMNTDIELSKAERENFTELINTNSDLLLNLINDILDLSRIESGRMSFSFQQYSLNELISTIYQTFQVLMPDKTAASSGVTSIYETLQSGSLIRNHSKCKTKFPDSTTNYDSLSL